MPRWRHGASHASTSDRHRPPSRLRILDMRPLHPAVASHSQGTTQESAMSSNMKFVTMTICLAVCSSLQAQTAPPPATAKPLSTSLGMVVFPAKGQTPQKQSQDEGECYAWSK